MTLLEGSVKIPYYLLSSTVSPTPAMSLRHPSRLIELDETHQTTGIEHPEPMFYYFAYGSCMCPVDLKRSLGEPTHPYVVGPATLKGYRLGFFRRSQRRNCGVLDVIPDSAAMVEGVLYCLPLRLSDRLDEREEGYCHETITVHRAGRVFSNVRTYTVIEKMTEEHAPNDWYFNVVLQGAVTCGLPDQYCWKLFHHMQQLQQSHQLQQSQTLTLRSA
jgi:cation transport regulator ChaC